MAPVGAAALRPVVTPRPPVAPAEAPARAPQGSVRGIGASARTAPQVAQWGGQSSFEDGASRLRLQLLRGGAETAPLARPSAQPVARQAPAAPVGERIGNRGNLAMDGQLMTTADGGTTWGTGVAPSQIPGANGRGTVLWVNGINTSAADHQGTLGMLEQNAGVRAVGLYNATQGTIRDTLQVRADRNENAQRAAGTWQGPSQNAATRSLSDAIVNHLTTSQEPLHLMAHSQGALVTANALYDVRQRLTAQHGAERANEMMGRLQVETFGGAARNYVDGPNYTHWINTGDNVTGGMGPDERTGGRGATFRRFNFDAPGDALNHNFQSVYWPERQRQLRTQAN
jgi:hypothetical protein